MLAGVGGEAGMLGTKKPLQQGLRGTVILSQTFLPAQGLHSLIGLKGCPQHRDRTLEIKRTLQTKGRSWGEGRVLRNQEVPAAGAGGALHSPPARVVHIHLSGWIDALQEQKLPGPRTSQTIAGMPFLNSHFFPTYQFKVTGSKSYAYLLASYCFVKAI